MFRVEHVYDPKARIASILVDGVEVAKVKRGAFDLVLNAVLATCQRIADALDAEDVEYASEVAEIDRWEAEGGCLRAETDAQEVK